jgi:hypothetical protein
MTPTPSQSVFAGRVWRKASGGHLPVHWKKMGPPTCRSAISQVRISHAGSVYVIFFMRIHLAASLDCVALVIRGCTSGACCQEMYVHTSGSVLSTLASRGE